MRLWKLLIPEGFDAGTVLLGGPCNPPVVCACLELVLGNDAIESRTPLQKRRG